MLQNITTVETRMLVLAKETFLEGHFVFQDDNAPCHRAKSYKIGLHHVTCCWSGLNSPLILTELKVGGTKLGTRSQRRSCQPKRSY